MWYHLTFLLTIVPLIVFGARLGRGVTVARRAAKAEDAVTTP